MADKDTNTQRAYVVVASSPMNPLPEVVGVYPDMERAARAEAECIADEKNVHVCKTVFDPDAW